MIWILKLQMDYLKAMSNCNTLKSFFKLHHKYCEKQKEKSVVLSGHNDIFLMDLYPCTKQKQIFIKIHLGIICVPSFVVILLFCSSSCFCI